MGEYWRMRDVSMIESGERNGSVDEWTVKDGCNGEGEHEDTHPGWKSHFFRKLLGKLVA